MPDNSIQIKKKIDGVETNVYPVTSANLVYDKDGVTTVQTKIDDLNTNLDNMSHAFASGTDYSFMQIPSIKSSDGKSHRVVIDGNSHLRVETLKNGVVESNSDINQQISDLNTNLNELNLHKDYLTNVTVELANTHALASYKGTFGGEVALELGLPNNAWYRFENQGSSSSSYGSQIATQINGAERGSIFTRQDGAGTWTSWRKLVTNSDLTNYTTETDPLTFNDNYTKKTSSGRIYINSAYISFDVTCNIPSNSGYIDDLGITLPEKYRPKVAQHIAGFCATNTNTHQPVTIRINPSGTMTAFIGGTSANAPTLTRLCVMNYYNLS